MTVTRFHWMAFDVRSLLPADWQEQIITVAKSHAKTKVLITQHSTSREGRKDTRLPIQSVGGNEIALRLPWLRTLYEREFLQFAQMTTSEPVSLMSNSQFAIALNIQTGSERYECHVDTNPIEGLLYATTHREGEGGELLVSNRGEAKSIEEVDADATIVEPKAGYLLFFDGRRHSHYVASLKDPNSIRVAVAMNYYVPSWPEQMRPADLNTHLLGQH